MEPSTYLILTGSVAIVLLVRYALIYGHRTRQMPPGI
jgi:hypothetical protein